MTFAYLPPVTFRDQYYDSAFLVVCRLSGYLTAIPLWKTGFTAEKAAEVFLERCISFMGLPCEIFSDNDHLLSSAFFTTMCEELGIEQHFSIPYRTRGNDRAENAKTLFIARGARTDRSNKFFMVIEII